MNWIVLIVAGLFETGFAFCLEKTKTAQGSFVYYWWGGFVICLLASMYLLYCATKTLPIGTAYAVWTGIGAVGTVLLGIFVFEESASFWRVFFLFGLIGSIAGLKWVSH